MESKVSVKSTIPKQVPAYIEEDHPIFVSFVEAYFEYLERENGPISFVRDALKYIDPSETMDEFITNFFEEMKGIPHNILADKSLLAQHIIELYQAKGTIKGYELLFRLMFNEDIEVYLPKLDLLRPSDGKWSKNLIIRGSLHLGDPFECLGKEIFQSDVYGNKVSRARVENVILNADLNVYDLYLSQSSVVGDFSDAFVYCEDIIVKIERSPKFLTKGSKGSGYVAGDSLDCYCGSPSSAQVIVAEVNGGPIEQVFILDGGSGFSVGDMLDVDSTIGEGADIRITEVNNGVATKVRIVSGGQGYQSFVRMSKFDRGIFVGVGSNIGSIKSFQTRDPGTGHLSPPEVSVDTLALITEPSGSFSNNETITILDSRVITEEYDDLILEDGSAMLSEFQEDYVYDFSIVESGNNTAKISGFFGALLFETEDSVGYLISEDGTNLVGESSNGSIDKRTIRGDLSGATAKIVYINPADIDTYLTSIYDTGARFINDDGKLSEITKKIQDSRYYQEFSYVIRSNQSIGEYRNAIYRLMHPAGTVAFGAIDVESKVELIIKTVSNISGIIFKIIEIYIKQSQSVHSDFYKATHAKVTRAADKDYRWIEMNKFNFGPHEGTFTGANLRNLPLMRDNPSLPDQNHNYNMPMDILGGVTFNDFYSYNVWEYTYMIPEYSEAGYVDGDGYVYSTGEYSGYTEYGHVTDGYYEEEIPDYFPYFPRDTKVKYVWESEITIQP